MPAIPRPVLLLAPLVLIPLVLAAATVPAGASDLDRYRWKSRVLVIAAEDGDPRATAQARIAETSAMRERDLVVVRAIGDGREAAALRRHLGLPATGFRAVLVGKDGGQKLTAAEPIPAETLVATIDAMPMRREEAAGRRN